MLLKVRRIYGPDDESETPPIAELKPFDPGNITPEFQSESDDKVTLSQKELSKIMGNMRKQLRAQNEKTANELQSALKTVDLTAKQREQMELQLANLRSTLETTAEKSQTELQRVTKEFETYRSSSTAEVEKWQRNFKTTLKDIEVQRAADAANVVKPFGPKQLRALLEPNLEVVEDADKDGKPTGAFKTVVLTKNAEGVEIRLPVLDFVKQLDEQGENPNLFEHTFKSGLNQGHSGNAGGGANNAPKDPKKLAEWLKTPENRASFMAQPANKGN